MRVLLACEESQAVCIEFRKLGHEAFSCDILPCSGGHPEWHIQGDVIKVLNDGWDMMIAFPPCTHLAVSGARWFKHKEKEQAEALEFVKALMNAPIKKIAIENPIGIIGGRIFKYYHEMTGQYHWEIFHKKITNGGRKPDQIIQPWQFGHGETKATCLWLTNLPKLKPTDIVEGREQKIWKMPPSPDRAKLRSKTFPGIAKAMAEQWGKINNI